MDNGASPSGDRAFVPTASSPQAVSPVPVPSAVADIAAERLRQIEVEGWSLDHDDQHNDGSLALAAALYAAPIPLFRIEVEQPDKDEMYGVACPGRVSWVDPWPWKRRQHVRHDLDVMVNDGDNRGESPRRRDLVKAAALLVAEIERLDRAASAIEARSGETGTGSTEGESAVPKAGAQGPVA